MSLELAVNQSTLIDPFISIIVTVYNKQGTLNTLLNTLSDIDLGLDHEVIIVNDASTDNSEQIIQSLCKQHSHFKYFCLDQNLGAGNARNVGAKIATGKYLCFFDAVLTFKARGVILNKKVTVVSNRKDKFISFRNI